MNTTTPTNIDALFLPTANDLGPATKSTIWILTLLAAILLAARIHAQLAAVHHHTGPVGRLQWDDWALISAWLALLGQTVFVHVAVDFGLGRRGWSVPGGLAEEMNITQLVATTLGLMGLAWGKTGFVVMLVRFVGGMGRLGLVVGLGLLDAGLAVAVALVWARCMPVEKLWRPGTEGTCLGDDVGVNYGVAVGAYSGFTNLVLTGFLWALLKDVVMKREEKVAVWAAGLLSSLAAVAAGIKCSLISVSIPAVDDHLYNEAQLAICIVVEVAAVIMAASMPLMRPLARHADKPKAEQDQGRLGIPMS